MIPILYDKNETAFASNGLGRLRDCKSCVVTEERNGIYECDFEYPITGAHYNEIQLGRIIGVTHEDYLLTREVRTRAPLTDEEDDNLTDEEGLSLTAARTKTIPERDIQPFDIVSFSKPINGVVTFHCVHISYRQSYMTVTGSGISSLADAFTLLATAEPDNPFTYWTDMSSSAYMACADGLPKTVRSMLGGVEGSVLDTYGGEYEWDRFTVKLWSSRGTVRNFTIRYGVNMLEYNDETDAQGTYSSCIPYWTDGTNTVIGDRVDSYGSTVTGRGECVPLDLSDKFETQPTKAQVEAEALSQMSAKNPFLATQTINVSFVRLQDMGEYENLGSLLQCRLCDTVKVLFHDYGTTGRFKIVKTVWNVLLDRFESMELGTLSTTLAQALGISNSDRVGGNGGAKTLLWTNSSPDASFTPSTILDSGQLNGYSEVEIWASFLGLNSPVYPTRVLMGTSSSLSFQNLNTATATNASTFINGVARDVSVSTSGITFGNGQMTYNGGAYVNWNDRAIPYKVYGIKNQ